MKLAITPITLAAAIVLSLTGCNQQNGASSAAAAKWVDNSKVLASVNGVNITENMLRHVEKTLGIKADDEPAMRDTIVNEMIKRRLLADYARAEKMDQTDDFRMTMMMAEESALVEVALKECERFYPAIQFVLWGGKGPSEAVAAAMFETEGEA